MSQDSHKTIRVVLWLVSLLLVIDGILALYGCLVYQGHDTSRVYDALGAAIILLTGLTIWIDNKNTLWLTLLCVLVLTIDEIRQVAEIRRGDGSIQIFGGMARPLLNIVLYWASYLAYRRWKMAKMSR
jgi:hypothetical protein